MRQIYIYIEFFHDILCQFIDIMSSLKIEGPTWKWSMILFLPSQRLLFVVPYLGFLYINKVGLLQWRPVKWSWPIFRYLHGKKLRKSRWGSLSPGFDLKLFPNSSGFCTGRVRARSVPSFIACLRRLYTYIEEACMPDAINRIAYTWPSNEQ